MLLELLHVVEPLVIAILGNECFMGAPFHDATLMEYANLVGILDGRETVGNGYRGACFHEVVQGVLNETFAFCVEGTRGFVEDEYVGILQYGARYASALPLSTGKAASAGSESGLQLPW